MAVITEGTTTTPPLGLDYAASAVQSTLTAISVPPRRRTIVHFAAPLVPGALAVARELSIPVKEDRKLVNVAAPLALGLIGLGALALTTYGIVGRRPRY